MVGESWKNPWKLTAIGMALVIASALVTGLVVANWTGRESDKKASVVSSDRPATSVSSSPAARTVPTQSAINACNQSAEAQAGQRDKTRDTIIAGAIGAVGGAAVGAAGGAVVGGGSGAGKGAIIGGLVGAGGGTLYGLNENKKHDESYRNSYAACMHARGYTG
jgi:hypothetical protein